MKRFFKKYDYFFLLTALFGLCLLIVRPAGDFPLNDDWSYAKTVKHFYETGRYNIGEWAGMTLFTHIMWGYLFVKVFGFSFLVLRVSTYVSFVIGMWFLSKLIITITDKKWLAFFVCLVLLSNPIFFNLSNTFMTDVNYNTLLVICIYFAHDFFQSGRIISYLLVFVFSILLVLLRQFGITVPVCFALATLFYSNRRWLYALGALVLTLGVYFILRQYEEYLKANLLTFAAYRYSGDFDLFNAAYWNDFILYNYNMRARVIVVQVLVFVSPVTSIFLIHLVRQMRLQVIIPVLLFTIFILLFLCSDLNFQGENVFMNMTLGTETFQQTRINGIHNYSEVWEKIVDVTKYALTFISLLTITLWFVLVIQSKNFSSIKKPWHVFMPMLFCAHAFLIFISVSYFDRYHIPFITMAAIYFSSILYRYKSSYIMATLITGCFLYVAVLGTKDYFSLNTRRWEAYHYLRSRKISATKINGGFEINCWNEGKMNWWIEFNELKGYDYVIQFDSPRNFTPVKEFEFQRYFPYKKDKLYIFARKGVKTPE